MSDRTARDRYRRRVRSASRLLVCSARDVPASCLDQLYDALAADGTQRSPGSLKRLEQAAWDTVDWFAEGDVDVELAALSSALGRDLI